jgi:hypothetical protein
MADNNNNGHNPNPTPRRRAEAFSSIPTKQKRKLAREEGRCLITGEIVGDCVHAFAMFYGEKQWKRK